MTAEPELAQVDGVGRTEPRHPTVADCEVQTGQCHLCGDVAVPGRVLEIDRAARTATIWSDGAQATVALDLIDAEVGDEVLVHQGFAIERLTGHE